jgi:hypothetical protein
MACYVLLNEPLEQRLDGNEIRWRVRCIRPRREEQGRRGNGKVRIVDMCGEGDDPRLKIIHISSSCRYK